MDFGKLVASLLDKDENERRAEKLEKAMRAKTEFYMHESQRRLHDKSDEEIRQLSRRGEQGGLKDYQREIVAREVKRRKLK